METWEYVLVAAAIVILLSAAAYFFAIAYHKRLKETIVAKFRKRYNKITVDGANERHGYQLMVETENVLFLIKIIKFSLNHELIITNPTHWCINRSPREWRRQSKPEIVPGVKTFLDYKPDNDKRLVKIALVYPSCHNISRYLNESDVELVDYQKNINNVYFVRFIELENFFLVIE